MRRVTGLALVLSLAACAGWGEESAQRDAWTAEWNGRVDRAASDWEHPCATRPFIAWADGFLGECQSGPPDLQCDLRLDWVDERVVQCREWTAWQLRNFNQHERIEGAAPSMRIE